MSITLVLTASAGDRAAQTSEDGFTLAVNADSPVTIVVSTDPPDGVVTDVTLLRDGEEVAAPAAGTEREWALTGAQRFGTFKATAKEGTTPIESVATTIAPAQTAEPPSGDGEGVVEVAVGEYDPRFTAWTGGVFTALAAVLLVIVSALVLGPIEWSDQTVEPAPSATSTGVATPTPDTSSRALAADEFATASPAPTATSDSEVDTTNGTFSERSRLAISTLLVAVGGLLLLAGAFLAAVEVRGRQHAATSPGFSARGTADALEKVPEVLRRAGQLRGTIAVLIAGGLMLLLAVFTLIGARGLVVGPPSAGPSPSQEASEPAAAASGSGEPSDAGSTSATADDGPTSSPSP